jgi:phosphotransacetylase
VLRAAQAAIDEGLARPILVGRPGIIESRIARAGLRITAGADFELVDPEDDARLRDDWSDYRRLMGRRGVTPELAKATLRRSARTIAAMMARRSDADAMVCGMGCDGEMHGDAALSEEVRREFLPESSLNGSANLLVMPHLDAANILFNVLKVTGGKGITVGPILLGTARPVHILTPAATMRRVLDMTALAVAQAAAPAAGDPA